MGVGAEGEPLDRQRVHHGMRRGRRDNMGGSDRYDFERRHCGRG